VMLISQQGMILRMKAGDIRTIGRATQGVRLIEMEDGDAVVSVAKLAEKDDESDEAPAPGSPTPSPTP
jgi:DNA gyrase subunit A